MTESPTPTATGRAPETHEEDPQYRKEREKHEQEVEQRRWRENEPTFEDPEIRRFREAGERETGELEEKLMLRWEAEELGRPGAPPGHISGSEGLNR